MSAAVMARLAVRWGCSVQEVRERISARLMAAGLITEATSAVLPYDGRPVAEWLVLGVTDDDRIAVLDAEDRPVLWLDEEVRH